MTKIKQFFLGFGSAGGVEQNGRTKLLTDDNNPIKNKEIFTKGQFFTPEDNFLYIKDIFIQVEELPLVSEMYQLFQQEQYDSENNLINKITPQDNYDVQLFKFHRIEQHNPLLKTTDKGPFYKYVYHSDKNNNKSAPIITNNENFENSSNETLKNGIYDDYLNIVDGLLNDNNINYIVRPSRNNTYYSLSNPNQLGIDENIFTLETEPKLDGNGKIAIQYEKEIIDINSMSYSSEGFDILKNFYFYLNNDLRHPIYPFMDGQKIFKFQANEAQKIFSLTFDAISINNIIGYPKYQNKKKTGEYYSRGRLRLTLTYEASE